MDKAGVPLPTFKPRLDILPPAQRALWAELDATPDHFTLYGGTAVALRLGHRQSIDFDFFSRTPFDPAALAHEIPYLAGAEPVQIVSHALTCRVERGGPVLVSFFGNLGSARLSRARLPKDRKCMLLRYSMSPVQRR
jgi:hypothetical protein